MEQLTQHCRSLHNCNSCNCPFLGIWNKICILCSLDWKTDMRSDSDLIHERNFFFGGWDWQRDGSCKSGSPANGAIMLRHIKKSWSPWPWEKCFIVHNIFETKKYYKINLNWETFNGSRLWVITCCKTNSTNLCILMCSSHMICTIDMKWSGAKILFTKKWNPHCLESV